MQFALRSKENPEAVLIPSLCNNHDRGRKNQINPERSFVLFCYKYNSWWSELPFEMIMQVCWFLPGPFDNTVFQSQFRSSDSLFILRVYLGPPEGGRRSFKMKQKRFDYDSKTYRPVKRSSALYDPNINTAREGFATRTKTRFGTWKCIDASSGKIQLNVVTDLSYYFCIRWESHNFWPQYHSTDLQVTITKPFPSSHPNMWSITPCWSWQWRGEACHPTPKNIVYFDKFHHTYASRQFISEWTQNIINEANHDHKQKMKNLIRSNHSYKNYLPSKNNVKTKSKKANHKMRIKQPNIRSSGR